MMNPYRKPLITLTLLLTAALGACTSDNGNHESEGSREHATSRGEHEGGEHGERRGEHDRDGGEHGDREGAEESGTEYALDERYDSVRNGVRLILAYDSLTNHFRGSVENTTAETLERVRVEVHLSSGKELGPTAPADLAPGEHRAVELLAARPGSFERWTAHPEVGNEEHGHGEGDGEHD